MVNLRTRFQSDRDAPVVRHPIAARLFAGQVDVADRRGMAGRRAALLGRAHGRVLELGAGTGANFGHYPGGVQEVVAVEPDLFLHQRAVQAADGADVPIQVVSGVGEALDFPDGAFDSAVATWVLCSVARPDAVAAQLRRVLRPGGTLLVIEHVRSPHPLVGALQGAADVVWPLFSGGCHLGRDTVEVLRAAGFTVEQATTFRFGIPPLDPPKPHVAGVLRRPR